jgi:hypothetical protein
VYPTRYPCITSVGRPKLDREDTAFIDSFPTLPRTTGWLSPLFGYDEKPSPSQFLNDMDAPLYKEARLRRKIPHSSNWFIRWLRRLCLGLGALINILWNFCWPEIRRPAPVPEISVTTPTPIGSTTKVYTYFAKESKDLGTSKLEKLQAHTEALIKLSERPQDPDYYSDDDNSSSSSDNEEELQLKKQRNLKIQAIARSMTK